MSPIKWLNIFLIIENISGIYRNYSNQTKFKKYLIILQILVQNLVYALIIICVLYIFLNKDSYGVIWNLRFSYCGFVAVNHMNYLMSVVYGITYSHTFASYYMSITRVYESLKSHKELIYSLKTTRYWASIVFNLYASVFSCYRSTKIFQRYFILKNISVVFAVPILASETIIKSTIVFEHFVLFIVVMTIVDLSKTLISLMVDAQQRVHRCGTSEVITGETINRWVELYQELVNCCDKVAVCFRVQYISFLTITIMHFIILMYYVTYSRILRIENYSDVIEVLMIVIIYIIMMLMPIVATQMASNQWVRCQRVMARLHNSIIEDVDTAERKMIKDFLRVIKKHPLHIRFMSKVPFGIFLLPAILSVVVNYVIVLLQFNHVV